MSVTSAEDYINCQTVANPGLNFGLSWLKKLNMTEIANDNNNAVLTLSTRCVEHINRRFGLKPDFSSETLSVLDYYVESLVCEENRGESPPPGDETRYSITKMFAPTLGAYFGETAARLFSGRWRFTDKAPHEWRLEFASFFLRFNPVGIAANVVVKDTLLNWGGEMVTAPSLDRLLHERFEAAPLVAEDDFFSFATCFESLQIASDFLKEISRKDGHPDCSEEGYDRVLSEVIQDRRQVT